MHVKFNNIELTLSPGKHNQLQKAVMEEFAPRFAPNSECLYIDDTKKKVLLNDTDKLKKLGFDITLHNEMPDIVLYREDKNWLYFIECVTSVGPMDPQRVQTIEDMTKNVSAGVIFITVFPDNKTFNRFDDKLAWDTEVWLSEWPEHMIHLNGDRFLGPR